MGSYLKFDGEEINSKSISYPMADIIRTVVPATENGNHDFMLSREDLCLLIESTRHGLMNYSDEELKEWEIFKGEKTTDIRAVLNIIDTTFVLALVKMVRYDINKIIAEWQ